MLVAGIDRATTDHSIGDEELPVREVREGLARSVRLVSKIGEATQFFYAAAEDRHYMMLGMFFLAEFPDEPKGQGTQR